MRKLNSAVVAILATMAFTTSAIAEQNPCGAKQPAKPVKKGDPVPAKKAPPPDTVGKPEPAPEMAEPEPPAELTAEAKRLKGTWFCKGTMAAPDGSNIKTSATMKIKVDLDKFWLKNELSVKKMKGAKRGYKMTSYRTFSASDSKWYEYSVDNMGMVSTSSSSGPDAAGKIVWDTEMRGGGMTMKSRGTEEPVLDKAGKVKKNAMRIAGEMSMDGGKTFVPAYDMTCTK